MKPGFLEYKCRRCGERHRSVHTPDITTTMVEVIVHGKAVSFPGIPVGPAEVHTCGDGGIGWADIVGAVPDEGGGE